MKAVLVIDMPQACKDCCFCQSGEPSWCDLMITNYRDIENEHIRQEWCPFKPLPHKKVFTEGLNDFQKGAKRGWNDCIDKILGEMSWDILSENASEKEKLKAEVNDFFHGLNAVGEIDWLCYSELYDVCMPILDRCYDRMEKAKAEFYKILGEEE